MHHICRLKYPIYDVSKEIKFEIKVLILLLVLNQCFSTAGPRPGTGPWHQLYRAARDFPGIDN